MRYSLVELMLNEYTDKLINQMYAVYKPQTTDSDDQIKQNIKDYDRLRGAVDAKLKQNNPAVLKAIPDDLKKNDKFKDITLIKDYNTLVRIIKSVTKKEIDIYKQAIEYFKKKDIYMEPAVIGAYVGQFKKNKSRIEQAINAKDANVLALIPDEILKANKGADILSYRKFSDLEKLIDGAFPFEGKEKEELNSATSDGELIYKNDSDGIEIYKGDNEHRCVKYGKNQYYSWCISRVVGSMYPSYRYKQLAGKNKMFYFVFDRTQPDTKEGRFVNPYHVVVINAYENGKYARTTAQNEGDDPYNGTDWDKLGEYFKGEDGQRMWNKIKGLQKYMPFIPPSAEERRQLGFKGQRLTLDAFIDLDTEDKQAWLRANAGDRNLVTPEIIKSLDNEQINDLINYDRKFSFDELKKSQGLLKRYADYRFTRHPKEPLPYNFISFLKPELQEKYYDMYEENYLTFDIIEKFFNEDILKKYINKQLNDLSYLPERAKKYMSNDQKQLFDLYSLVFKDSTFTENPVDENSVEAPIQSIRVPSISQESFNELNTNDKKKLIDFYMKIADNSKNAQKYAAFFVGFPITFKLNNKTYFVTYSSKKNLDVFVIMDEDGKTIYDDLRYVDFFKNNDRISLNPYIQKQTGSKSTYLEPEDFDSLIIQKIDGEDKKITKDNFRKKLNEILLENYNKRKLLFRAGILK